MNINNFIKCFNLTSDEIIEVQEIIDKIKLKSVYDSMDIIFEMMQESPNFKGVTISTFICESEASGLLFHRPK